MNTHTFPMTKLGLKNLKEELIVLESKKRANALQRIKRARGFCDFQEDSEYEAALRELATIDERTSSIKHIIKNVKIIDTTTKVHVELGSTISFKDISNNEIETYTIVGHEEADPIQGTISNLSPIAKQLLGAKVNEKVNIKTPSGERLIKIMNIM